MLTLLVKLFKALNSEQSPGQIAAAVSLAAIVGLTPLLSLHNVLILLVVLFFRVNLTVFLVLWPVFKLLGLLIAPLAETLGVMVLQAEAITSVWETFYNTLIGRWSNFYYSGVIGSLLIALATALLLFPLSKVLVVRYREKWLEKLEQYHLVKMLKASKFWQLYQKLSN